MKTDIVIIGSGVAGLYCALNLPEEKQIIMGTWGIPFDDILIEYDGNTRPQLNKGNEEKLELPFTFDDED